MVQRAVAEAASQAAAQQGFQAGQAAAQAEQAMLNQLRQRQNALLATAGQAPTTFAEQTGQMAATQGVEGGMEGLGYLLAAGMQASKNTTVSDAGENITNDRTTSKSKEV